MKSSLRNGLIKKKVVLGPNEFYWFTRCKLLSAGLFFIGLLHFSSSSAQQNDFGIWASIAVKHKFSQRFSATVEEQFRFNRNASSLGQYFTDAGVEYSLSKKIRIALYYRFTNSNRETYYSKRHRLYADLSYKTKLSPFQILLRTRIQGQQQDIHSSDFGKIPSWYSRNKISVKLDLNKKYSPFLSAELFYMLSAPNQEHGRIDQIRYAAGIEYEINRIHTFELSYLIQQEKNVNNPATDFVAAIGYVFSF